MEMTVDGWTIAPGDVPLTQFPFLTTQQQMTFEADHLPGSTDSPLTEVDTVRTVDPYGTVTSEDVKTYAKTQSGGTQLGLVSEETVTPSNFIKDTSAWILGLARDITRTAQRSSSGLSFVVPRHDHFEYYPGTRLLQSAEREPGADSTTTIITTYGRSDGHGNVTQICATDGVDPGRCTSFDYDAGHIFPVTVTDPDGPMQVQYSPRDGQLLWTIDQNGLTSEIERDAFGRVQEVETPTSSGTIQYLNAANFDATAVSGTLPSPIWPAIGVSSTFKGEGTSLKVLDAFGRPVQETTPGFSGTSGGDVLTERLYDAFGNVTFSTLPHRPNDTSQGVVQYSYDAFKRLNVVTQPDGSTTSYFYPTRDTLLANLASWFGPTKDGPIAATSLIVEKPRGNLEGRVLDPKGLPIRTFQSPGLADGATTFSTAGSATVDYLYQGFDYVHELDATQGSKTIVTSMMVDSLGRTLELDDPSLGAQKTTYNGFDEVASTTDAALVQTDYVHDAKGRLTDTKLHSTSEVLSHFEYGTAAGEIGRLATAYRETKPGSGVVNRMSYHYQGGPGGAAGDRGLLTSIDYRLGGSAADALAGQAYTVGFDYPANSSSVPWQLARVNYPDNGGGPFSAVYGYDPSGAVNTVQGVQGTVQEAAWRLLDTDEGFRPSQELFGNGLQTTREYYSLTHGQSDCGSSASSCSPGLLRSITTQASAQSSDPVQTVRYNYDPNHNVTTATVPNSLDVHGYAYDGFDRLTSEQFAQTGEQNGYTYDLTGDITSVASTLSGVSTYTYGDPSKPHQITSTGDTTYQYDDNGRQTQRSGAVPSGFQKLAYDPLGMPLQIQSGQGASATVTQLEYDATSTRLLKRKLRGNPVDGSTCSSSNPAACTNELTIDIGELYEEVKTFANGCDPKDEAKPGVCATTGVTYKFRMYAGGRQVAQVERTSADTSSTASKVSYLHDDQLGSTSVVTDVNGAVSETRRFSAFGETRTPNFSAASGVLSGFAGLEHDDELGLVNMRGRLYDPHLARFVSPDPFVFSPLNPQGLNRYSYVRNNPLRFVDPSGFEPDQGGGGTPRTSGAVAAGGHPVTVDNVTVAGENDWGIGNIPGVGQGYIFYVIDPDYEDYQGGSGQGAEPNHGDDINDPTTGICASGGCSGGQAPQTTPQPTDAVPSGHAPSVWQAGSNGGPSSGDRGGPATGAEGTSGNGPPAANSGQRGGGNGKSSSNAKSAATLVVPVVVRRGVLDALADALATIAADVLAPWVGAAVSARDSGDDSGTGYSDRPGKIAKGASKKLGRDVTADEVNDAIHEAKKGLDRGGSIRNPDVEVHPDTGDIRPKTPSGGLGDSIGNLYDFLE
jgi:RHS repeat-associated protein